MTLPYIASPYIPTPLWRMIKDRPVVQVDPNVNVMGMFTIEDLRRQNEVIKMTGANDYHYVLLGLGMPAWWITDGDYLVKMGNSVNKVGVEIELLALSNLAKVKRFYIADSSVSVLTIYQHMRSLTDNQLGDFLRK